MLDFAIGFVVIAALASAVWFAIKQRRIRKRSKVLNLSPVEKDELMRKDSNSLTLSESIQRKILEVQSDDTKPL